MDKAHCRVCTPSAPHLCAPPWGRLLCPGLVHHQPKQPQGQGMLRTLKLGGLRLSLTRSVRTADQVKTHQGVFTFPCMALAPVCFLSTSPERRGQDPPSLGNNVCCGGDSLHSQLMAFVIDYTFVLAFNQLQQLSIPTYLAQQ